MRTLYTGDFITVVGQIVDFSEDKVRTFYIKLVFTLQINGKLRTFEHIFDMCKGTIHDIELVNYDLWYKVYRTLSEIGYTIGDSANIINEFIYSLKKD